MACTFRRRKTTTSNGSGSSSSPTALLGPKGTRPWTGGITLTSTGLRDMDQLLGGGQPLGTCIWLDQDRWTNRGLSACLIQYWCAEAISQEQHLFIPTTTSRNDEPPLDLLSLPSSWQEDAESTCEQDVNPRTGNCPSSIQEEIHSLLQSLPRNLHMDKQAAAGAGAESSSSPIISGDNGQLQLSLGSLQEGITEEDQDDQEGEKEEDTDAGLTIAWQYKASVQRERQGQVASSGSLSSRNKPSTSDVFCHSYDLRGRLQEQINVMEATCLAPIVSSGGSSSQSTQRNSRERGFAYFCELLGQLKPLLSGTPHKKVVRILFYHPDPSILQVALPLLLAHIRTRLLPIVIMVAVQPWTRTAPWSHSTTRLLQLLRRSTDVVFAVEGFAARREYPPPPEFRMFHGLLHVHKASTMTAATAIGGGHFADATASRRPAAHLYGLKRDRRKLHIELLHIPPEDYAQGGGSAGGGVRSGAGRPSQVHKAATAGSGGLGCASSGASLIDF